MKVVFRLAAVLALVAAAGSIDLMAQERRGALPPGGRQGRGQMGPGDGLTPREIQAQFDAYVIAQAEGVLRISEDQYPQFVRRVRALQMARREARMRRNRLVAQLAQLARSRENVDEAKLAAATRAIDEHERATPGEIARAFASLDEVLTPWQRARFRVLEDQLEQKKLDMVLRARQGPRR